MNPFIWFKPLPFIGLEIADDEIRLLALKHSAGVLKIDHLSSLPLPKNTIQEGKIQQPQEIICRLKEWKAQTKIKNPPAAIAMPSVCVMTKRFRMPLHWQEEECETEIAALLNQHQPKATEEWRFDFSPLGEPEEGYQEVLIVAVRRTQLESYVEPVQQAGFKVKSVDVDVYALIRALTWGAKHADVTVLKDLEFAHPFNTAELKNELRLMIQQQNAYQTLLSDFDHNYTYEVIEKALVSFGLALRGISE